MTLVIHIGAPKTATSTLQNAFFPAHRELMFLGKKVDRACAYEGWPVHEIGALMRKIEAGGADGDWHDAARSLARRIRDEAAGRPVVISDEGLSVFTGVDGVTKLRCITDLFETLAPFRLIYCVREQLELILSNYLTEHRGEMLHLPGTDQNWYPDFDRFLDIHFRYACGAVLNSYRYAAMIERYEALVGSQNMFVYGFEDFKREPTRALAAICRFMGVSDTEPCLEQTATTRENEHYSARVYALNGLRRLLRGRRMGALLPKSIKERVHRWIGRGARFTVMPSPDAVRRVRDYYRTDNDVLFRTHGIRL